MLKKHAPATLRNREAILAVLREELPLRGRVLEVASGSGEHAIWFAAHLPQIDWQPSDFDPQAIGSIAAYREESGGANVRAPIVLNAQAPQEWNCRGADAIVCINMIHIAPWAATRGLFQGAAQLLGGTNLPLILYGPYFEHDAKPAGSNVDFDTSLRTRNPQWGIRYLEEVDALAAQHGFHRTARHDMPANNLTLVYRQSERA